MLAFVDESGDPHQHPDSSPYLVLAMVVFVDSEHAREAHERIDQLRIETDVHQRFEYHFARNKPFRRRQFMGEVSDLKFGYHVFSLNKTSSHLTGPAFGSPALTYNYTARLLLDNAADDPINPLSEAEIVFDRRGNRDLRSGLEEYLTRMGNRGEGTRVVVNITSRPAEQNNLLQLADYVAGTHYRALLGQQESRDYIRDFLRSHQWSSRLWPSRP